MLRRARCKSLRREPRYLNDPKGSTPEKITKDLTPAAAANAGVDDLKNEKMHKDLTIQKNVIYL